MLGAVLLLVACVSAVPAPDGPRLGPRCDGPLNPTNPGEYWVERVEHNGQSSFNPDPNGYKVFRNVKDYGARGDGVTDDTAAINAAIDQGGRCGHGCDSSTISPALVYFPAGTYVVSTPIIPYYFTQMVGDLINPPTIKAAPNFNGIAMIDADPYDNTGNNWYINQGNFYRQVRNFVLDTRDVPAGNSVTGIHWQVSQATQLSNVRFELSQEPGNNHQGMFMENGSGGYMGELLVNGGKIGLSIGNQQFTVRNVTFNNCATAMQFIWNWGWTFKNININNCQVGADVTVGGEGNAGLGSVLFVDSTVSNTDVFVKTVGGPNTTPKPANTLYLDNIHLNGVGVAVQHSDGHTILDGGSRVIDSWGQGHIYHGSSGGTEFFQGDLQRPNKASVLLDGNGNFFERARPNYGEYGVGDFINVKSEGVVGDGQTDDTAALNAVLTNFAGCKILYFPAGTYIFTDTLYIPPDTRMVGETWSQLMLAGNNFNDQNNPKPAIKVGNAGESGIVEISEFVFATRGDQSGAVLVQWNIRDPAGQQGAAALFDSHFRIGGTRGTDLEESQCARGSINIPACNGPFALLHLTETSSAYLENVWGWTADHDIDGSNQINLFTGRGILVDGSQGPIWMYGTASEHNVLYQYQVSNSRNVFMGLIQTETPYFQANPPAPQPYTPNAQFSDPEFNCEGDEAQKARCAMAWGLRIYRSSQVYVYGAGLYNFFQNYDQTCLDSESCQEGMVSVEDSTEDVHIFQLNTKASVNMIHLNGQPAVPQDVNHNTFTSTIGAFYPS